MSIKNMIESIKRFTQTANTHLLGTSTDVNNGGFIFRKSQTAFITDEKIHLSPELSAFYGHCEVICSISYDGHKEKSASVDLGNFLMNFCAPESLVCRQEGFRWIGTNQVENERWNPFWLVIADVDDNPIVVVTDKEHSPVMASYETGDLIPIADSFADFLDYISLTIEVVYSEYSGEIVDESFVFLDCFLEDLRKRLNKVTDKNELVENFIRYLYG